MKAMQAEVKSLKEEVTKLSQDRSATSTSNRSSRNKDGRKSGGGRGNSNNAQDQKSTSGTPQGILKNGGEKKVTFPNNPPGTNGLSTEENSKVSELVREKFKTMPRRKDIADDAVYEIELDGKVVAIYCKQCRRFTRGDKKHKTTEHRGRPQAKAKASGMMAMEASPAPPVPPPVSSPVCVPIRQPVSYDFGSTTSPLQRSGQFLACAPAPEQTLDPCPSDDDSVGSVDNRLLAALGRAYPKGLGRQG